MDPGPNRWVHEFRIIYVLGCMCAYNASCTACCCPLEGAPPARHGAVDPGCARETSREHLRKLAGAFDVAVTDRWYSPEWVRCMSMCGASLVSSGTSSSCMVHQPWKSGRPDQWGTRRHASPKHRGALKYLKAQQGLCIKPAQGDAHRVSSFRFY